MGIPDAHIALQVVKSLMLELLRYMKRFECFFSFGGVLSTAAIKTKVLTDITSAELELIQSLLYDT